jgi:beta-phosphoglucomutase-like phosphatase (HAD superfamily)
MRIQGIIFDMDGTMIDSMPYHAKSWVAFVERHRLSIEVNELLRRTTRRTGAMARGLRVGTAGDKHNIAFAFSHLGMDPLPHAVAGGPHVVASVRNHHELIESNFLGNLHAIPA